MGFPKKSIDLAIDGAKALNVLLDNLYEHCQDSKKKLFCLIIADHNIPFISGLDVL